MHTICYLTVVVHSWHYQFQFNEKPIKSLWKTHEPIFHGHENGDSKFHGLFKSMNFPWIFNWSISWPMNKPFMAMKNLEQAEAGFHGAWNFYEIWSDL